MNYHRYGIHKWKEVNGKIYVNQDVDLSGYDLKEIPFKLHIINGNFSAKGNKLKTLDNFPDEINGDFNVSYNRIESLRGFPSVKRSVFLESNELNSLKHIQKVINGNLDISNNPLETIDYAPIVKEDCLFSSFVSLETNHLEIYKKALKEKKWNPELSLDENLRKIDDNFLKKLYIDVVKKHYIL